MGAYVGFLIIRSIEKVFSGLHRVSRAPNRHVTWTVTGDLSASVDHAADAFGGKHTAIVFAGTVRSGGTTLRLAPKKPLPFASIP